MIDPAGKLLSIQCVKPTQKIRKVDTYIKMRKKKL